MGQYYHIAIKPKDGEVVYNKREVEGVGYTTAKLTEHSYSSTWIMKSVMSMLEKTPCKVAWVGDYSEDEEVSKITNGEVNRRALWPENGDPDVKTTVFKKTKFPVKSKWLVNHAKKTCVKLAGGFFRDSYKIALQDGTVKTRHLLLNPIPVLTAIGNGRGGGDYFGPDEELAGSWAWDELSIENSIPRGYHRLKHLPRKKAPKKG